MNYNHCITRATQFVSLVYSADLSEIFLFHCHIDTCIFHPVPMYAQDNHNSTVSYFLHSLVLSSL
jgi:hypothetical protein